MPDDLFLTESATQSIHAARTIGHEMSGGDFLEDDGLEEGFCVAWGVDAVAESAAGGRIDRAGDVSAEADALFGGSGIGLGDGGDEGLGVGVAGAGAKSLLRGSARWLRLEASGNFHPSSK